MKYEILLSKQDFVAFRKQLQYLTQMKEHYLFMLKRTMMQSQWQIHVETYYKGKSTLEPIFMNVALLMKIFGLSSPLQPKTLVLKINESRYLALFVVSGSVKKLFSIDCANIYLLYYFFQNNLHSGKKQGYHTLFISWFINFKGSIFKGSFHIYFRRVIIVFSQQYF